MLTTNTKICCLSLPRLEGRKLKALTLASFLFPFTATIGRTGIVVFTLQENENPMPLTVAIGVSMLIAYWALFSGYIYAAVQHNYGVVQFDHSADGEEVQPLMGVSINAGGAAQKEASLSPFQQIIGAFGYLMGAILALSEGLLNFY